MKKPDLNLLPIAFALYDELSVSRAAHTLGMSQPAVSMALRKVMLQTPHFLSIPILIARSDLVATVPHALAIHFTRMSRDLALAMPPFEIAGFDVKQHWHRKYHNDPRNRWLREQVASLFNDETDEWRET